MESLEQKRKRIRKGLTKEIRCPGIWYPKQKPKPMQRMMNHKDEVI